MNYWKNFQQGQWQETIDVRDFILNNFRSYDGDADFLEKPTQRTQRVYQKYEELRQRELAQNGVLKVDTETVSSLLTFDAG
ncbi:MAG: formate acetyltransferase, partial [Vallitaleaceae bacterium]|nr:formate acetyltransferase [Vallitaleaceae bacterium]